MAFIKRVHIPTNRPVPGDGPAPARLMIIGERPGKDEDRLGRPFVGMSGQELDRYLDSVGLDRNEIYVTNLVKTYAEHPPNKAEIAEWEDQLTAELMGVEPEVIAALGSHAIRYFLGDVNVEDVHGIPQRIADGTLVVPVYHPASAFYDSEQGKFVQYDFEMLAATLRGELLPREDEHQEPRYEDLTSRPPLPAAAQEIAIDTEGYRDAPWGLSYSTRPGSAYNIRPQREEVIREFAEWVKNHPDALIILHNSLHDLGVLDRLGVVIGDDQFIDTMVLAYLLCVEPQGLKPLSRRHCGMHMDSYNDVLSTANDSIALEYLYGIADIDWGPADQYAIVVNGELKIKQPWGINRYLKGIFNDVASGKTNKEGEVADPRKRWYNIDFGVRERVEAQFGPMPEASLDDIPMEKAINYACRDADATLRVYPILWNRVVETGQELVAKIDHGIIPMVDRMQRNGFAVSPERLTTLSDKCDIIMAEKVAAIAESTEAMINPNSPDQVRDLLFEQLNLIPTKFTKGGKDHEGERKASTQDKVLESLRGEHPAVALITDYREASKVKSSFCLPILAKLREAPDSDQRLRCNLRITRVSSGRLAANSPNLMAIPVRSELGREVRSAFIAPPGRVLATWDLNQVEMRHMAHESGDELLCKLFTEGKRDVHGETASRMFKVPYDVAMDSSNTMKYRYPAKRVGFGVITGITGAGLLDQMKLANTGIEWTEESCDDLIENWFGVYRGVHGYMDRCRAEARRHGNVRDMWGRIRYLPGVHSPIPRVREEACRQSHSHKIQAGAQGIMKVAMIAIWKALPDLWAMGYYVEPLLQIHDEIIFELDDDEGLRLLMDQIIVSCLTTAHLDYWPGYRVPLRAKGGFGLDWGSLEK